jgi:8-oxo-dGTP diphosphatase
LEEKLPKFDSVFSIDCLIFGFEAGELKVLLIERNEEPFKDWWHYPAILLSRTKALMMLPSVFLYELTGLRDLHMKQFHTFGEVNRHPQGRVITVGYYALIRIKSDKKN